MAGFISAFSLPTRTLRRFTLSLASSNSAISSCSLQKARITRTPLRFSRVLPSSLSSAACALVNSGMDLVMMPKTMRLNTGSVAAKMSALFTSMVKAMSMAPSTMKGLLKSRRRARFNPFCT